MRDDVCSQCWPKGGEPEPTHSGTVKREPGYCTECGYFFDQWGMRLLDPITCEFHSPIEASCPHSEKW